MNKDRILLNIQRALVAEIDPSMRAICVEFGEKKFTLHVYVDDSFSEEIADDFDASVMTDLVADFSEKEFSEGWSADFKFKQECGDLPIHSGTWVFAKKGVRFKQKA